MQSGERIVIKEQDYRLDVVLSTGAGSYGQVWAATDATGHAVALKLINTEAMVQADPSLRGHWRAHLEREIAFLSKLDNERSRHIVALFDHGQINGQPVLVMERLSANLSQWLTQRRQENALPLELERILDWAGQILCGLDVIHDAGFVYRDLKFSNILVDDDGTLLKLADFGSLKRQDSDSTYSFIGTPATMAPEQALPARFGPEGYEYVVDRRADYYALGLLLFALLTDQPATVAQRRLGQLLAQHGQEGAACYREQLGELSKDEQELLQRSIEFWTVPALTQPDSGTAALLTDLIVRLLARDPNERPQDSTEIRAVLDAARANQLITPVRESELIFPARTPPNWDTSLPTLPPNRHSHHSRTVTHSRWTWRTMVLTGVFGLAGALAWVADIRPTDKLQQAHIEAPDTAAVTISSTPASPTNLIKRVDIPSSGPELTSLLATEPVAEPVAEPVTEPVAEPVAEPIAEPVVEPVARITAKLAHTHSSKPKPLANSITSDSSSEPSPEFPPVAPLVVKPAPKTPTPPESQSVHRLPSQMPTAKVVSPSYRDRTSKPLATRTTQRTAKVSPTSPSVISSRSSSAAPSNPVTRIESRRPPAPPTLPPIELKSRSQPTLLALPPIELKSRSQPASPTLPPIQLVSRADPIPAATPVPPPYPVNTTTSTPVSTHSLSTPIRRSASRPTKPARRSTDPITQFQKDAARATVSLRRNVEALADWMSHTSASLGTEVQRELDSTQRALTRNNTNRRAKVERRDYWSRRSRSSTIPPPRRLRD